MNVLQLDSIPVVARTQYVVLYSRLGPYRCGLLEELAYRDHEWLETWAHEASLVPMEHEPLFRWRLARSREGATWKSLVRFQKENAGYVADVLEEVRERGPLKAAQLSDRRRRAGEWWSARSGGSLALEWLYRAGEIAIRRGVSFDKSYDLYERVVPDSIRACPDPGEAEAQRRLLEIAARSLGVFTATDAGDYFRMSMKDVRPRLAELVEAGEIEPVQVEGWNQDAYLHRKASCPRSISRTTLLSPFDPIVWNRDRAQRLFGFEYRIEIYVPAAQRVHGYYVLPFLHGEELVARVDCKSHRKSGHFEVIAAYLEEGQPESETAAELAQALSRMASWLELERVVCGRRGDLMPALRHALKESV